MQSLVSPSNRKFHSRYIKLWCDKLCVTVSSPGADCQSCLQKEKARVWEKDFKAGTHPTSVHLANQCLFLDFHSEKVLKHFKRGKNPKSNSAPRTQRLKTSVKHFVWSTQHLYNCWQFRGVVVDVVVAEWLRIHQQKLSGSGHSCWVLAERRGPSSLIFASEPCPSSSQRWCGNVKQCDRIKLLLNACLDRLLWGVTECLHTQQCRGY